MSDLSPLVARSLATHLERVRARVTELTAPLSTEDLWRRPYAYGNSVGHLLLHLTGNLRYYVGAQMSGSGYVRDRPKEFADPSKRPTDEVLRDFQAAVDEVLRTLSAQGEADWGLGYQAVGAEGVADRLTMLVRCIAHADHHAGQMVYLCRELSRQSG